MTKKRISVKSKNVAKAIGAEVKPYDRTKIKKITVDGKEVRDMCRCRCDPRQPKVGKYKDVGVQKRHQSMPFRQGCISESSRYQVSL